MDTQRVERTIYENKDLKLVLVNDKAVRLDPAPGAVLKPRGYSPSLQDYLFDHYPDAYEAFKQELINRSKLK